MDRASKLPFYARHRVTHAWLIDPRAQTLEVFRLTSQHWLLLSTFRGDARVQAEPFDASELELEVLWARKSHNHLNRV
jgi:Uma2 family endonuclease